MRMYFNLICEEVELTGGKIIHIDINIGKLILVKSIKTIKYKTCRRGCQKMVA